MQYAYIYVQGTWYVPACVPVCLIKDLCNIITSVIVCERENFRLDSFSIFFFIIKSCTYIFFLN